MFGIFVGVSSACGEFVFSVCSLPNVECPPQLFPGGRTPHIGQLATVAAPF